MSEKLKPCPHCGQDTVHAVSRLTWRDQQEVTVWRVYCWGCDNIREVYSEEEAIENWNTRAQSPELQAVLDAADQWEQYVTYTMLEYGSERRSDAALVRAVRKLKEVEDD